MPTRGTSIQGSRAAHSVATPALHASDLEAGTPTVHLTAGTIIGQTPVWDGSQWLLVRYVCADGNVVTSEGDLVWVS